MKINLLSLILFLFISACSGGGGGSSGGSGNTTPNPIVNGAPSKFMYSHPTLGDASSGWDNTQILQFTVGQNISWDPKVSKCNTGSTTVGCSTLSKEGMSFSFSGGALPQGLSFNQLTGVISGTALYPTAQPVNINVFIENSYGSKSKNIQIFVTNTTQSGGQAPSVLFYNINPWTVLLNNPLSPQAPSVSNCETGCTYSTVTGILPQGVFLNSTTGVLSGTPTNAGSRTFVVRAQNSHGYDDTTVQMNVILPPPSGIVVSNISSGNMYRVGLSISPIEINYSSPIGSITSMTLNKPLPTGLSLDKIDSVNHVWRIRGNPSVSSPIDNYEITACGPTSPCATVSFQLGTGVAPTSLSYDISGRSDCVMDSGIPLCTFFKNQQFPDITPIYNGDNVSFEVTAGWQAPMTQSAPMPSGIGLSAATGHIYTTSIGAMETTTNCSAGGAGVCLYTIRVFNGLGSITTQIKIKVLNTAVVLGNFNYGATDFIFRNNTQIPSLQVSWDNGNLPSCHGSAGCYSISPTLPGGLSLSQNTGTISGTPNLNSIQNPISYTISATDPERGTRTTTIQIEIKQRVPSFVYNRNGSTFVIGKGQEISGAYINQELSYNAICGQSAIPVDNFSISPALPSGLSLRTGVLVCGVEPSSTGGAIIGTANEISEETTYTITGCNSGGCHSVPFKLEVVPQVLKVVNGLRHSCAIVKDSILDTLGTVQCWGANDKDQLGYVSSETCSDDNGQFPCSKKAQPVKLSGLDLNNVFEISAGDNHTCAIQKTNNASGIENSGRVYCWGDNSEGQLSAGSALASSRNPLAVIRTVPSNENRGSDYNIQHNLTTLNAVTVLATHGNKTCIGAEFTSVAYSIAAIVEDATSVTNISGELTPSSILTAYGQVYCNDSITKRMERVKNNLETYLVSGYNDNKLFVVEQLGIGDGFICGKEVSLVRILDTDPLPSRSPYYIDFNYLGKIKCIGNNQLGQLGDNSLIDSVNPVSVKFNNLDVALTDANLTVGKNHACYANESIARCWGDNSFGQLGNHNNNYEAQSVNIIQSSGDLFSSVSKPNGRIGATAYATFIAQANNLELLDYRLFSTGKHIIPELPYVGLQSDNPINVLLGVGMNLSVESNNVPNSSSAEDSVCTLPIDGGIQCYGKNDAGQLGNDSTVDSVFPVRVKFRQ